tara:strand:- start:1171 stop:1329 length:159 start_codon:yes stop_codon:yes gene_type:complete
MKDKHTIRCSRCEKTFKGGFEYRMHFDAYHLEEWSSAKDKAKYIKDSTQWQL